MTKEEMRKYMQDYNAEGFRKEVNRRYYMRNRERLKAERERKKKADNGK